MDADQQPPRGPRRPPPFPDSGVLLVDKPAGWTSHDVVGFIRSRFNVPKVGHCGTLDPAAVGLLVVVLGKATKLSQRLAGEDKAYEGEMLLGVTTDSQDMEGRTLTSRGCDGVTPDALRGAFAAFVGETMQTPPMVSAKKVDGKKLYELARAGQEIERESKPITIHRLELLGFEPPVARFSVHCSKGTYVRTLCHDIGARLGCGAALKFLRRTRSGAFDVARAVNVEEMRGWSQADLAARLHWVY